MSFAVPESAFDGGAESLEPRAAKGFGLEFPSLLSLLLMGSAVRERRALTMRRLAKTSGVAFWKEPAGGVSASRTPASASSLVICLSEARFIVDEHEGVSSGCKYGRALVELRNGYTALKVGITIRGEKVLAKETKWYARVCSMGIKFLEISDKKF